MSGNEIFCYAGIIAIVVIFVGVAVIGKIIDWFLEGGFDRFYEWVTGHEWNG